jgi:membrane associated rhomboid family serine protease
MGELPAQRSRDELDAAVFQEQLERVTPRAYVTPWLVGINVLIFVAMLPLGAGFVQPNGEVHILLGSNLGPLTTDGQWWRLLTSTFLHFGVIHLALNMWALYVTGRLVERLYGNLYFLALYVFSGLTASVASLVWNPMVNSVGASGAIFGVFGGMLAFMMTKGNRVPFELIMSQRSSTLAFIANTLLFGFTHAGIDNAAHLGGLTGGFLAGLLLARPLKPELRVGQGWGRLAASLAAGVPALVLLSFAIRIDPRSADVSSIRGAYDAKVYAIRGAFQATRGNFDVALADFDESIRLNPKSAHAYIGRGNLWLEKRGFDQAIADFGRAIEIDPTNAQVFNDLAWLLATADQPATRDGPRAVQLALKACELSRWMNAAMLDTLAAAYAREGDYVKAVEWERKAISSEWTSDGRERAQSRLRLYQDGKAWPPN